MTIIAVVGDATTTTAVALSVGWPVDGAVVLEADRAGGSLSGWLDTPTQPTLATIVATVGSSTGQRDVMDTVDAMTHRSASGVRFISNAVRARAANRAVEEASLAVLPAIGASSWTVIADAGEHFAGRPVSPVARSADAVVITHRQAAASAAAASVRIERLIETVEEFAQFPAALVLAVIGTSPFDTDEVGEFVARSVPDAIECTVVIADDPLAAVTIAGRSGVSAKRLRRLPLMTTAAAAAGIVDGVLLQRTPR